VISLKLFFFSFLCGISIFVAIIILIQYTKRAHILQHFKHFSKQLFKLIFLSFHFHLDSVVESAPVFTISKNDLKPNLNENATISEENPPSYSSPASPPPPYQSESPSTVKISE